MRARSFQHRALAVVCLLLALPAPAQEKPSREQELAAVRREIARLEARLVEARRQQTGVRGELAAIDVELALQERRLAEAQAARDVAATRAAAHEREVARLEAALETARRDLKRRLAGLYRLGRHGYLRLALSMRPGTEVLSSIRAMRYLARRDRQAIDGWTAARGRLAAERERLAAEREVGERWIRREAARRAELVRVRRRQTDLLARLEREGRALASRAGELVTREQKLANFLDFLYGRNVAVLSGKPMPEFRGVLDWPARGPVVTGFGPRLDPRYRTEVPHNGLAIATRAGDEVKAVYPGKVLFAAPFSGYGPTVVVHHPGRVFTLYAGLSAMRVGPQDVLSLGDVVGSASDRLYFEIRVENRPEDPLSWLR